jgi:hypothetical protein
MYRTPKLVIRPNANIAQPELLTTDIHTLYANDEYPGHNLEVLGGRLTECAEAEWVLAEIEETCKNLDARRRKGLQKSLRKSQFLKIRDERATESRKLLAALIGEPVSEKTAKILQIVTFSLLLWQETIWSSELCDEFRNVRDGLAKTA